MVVLLVGGPLDGDLIAVPDDAATYQVDQLVIQARHRDRQVVEYEGGEYRRPPRQMDVMFWHQNGT